MLSCEQNARSVLEQCATCFIDFCFIEESLGIYLKRCILSKLIYKRQSIKTLGCWILRLYKAFSIICLLVFSSFVATVVFAADEEKIAIFIPDERGNYRSVYEKIASGVAKEISQINNIKLIEYSLANDFSIESIIKNLNDQGINKVIALGRTGYKLIKQLPDDKFYTVSGGLPISPDGISGVSYIAHPEAIFSYLSVVAPKVKRIYVAHNEKSSWIIDLAKKAANKFNLELKTKLITSFREADEYYRQLFASKLTEQEAIWLPYDKYGSNKDILKIVIENAWIKNVAVFSSSPPHVRQGVLFSVFPDNEVIGGLLYQLLEEIEHAKDKKVVALSALQLAVNIRTAAHLGINYTAEQRKQFQLTFPSN